MYTVKKIIFIFSHLKFSRYNYQRWIQFLRLMTNTSVLPSILLGILTVFVAIYLDRFAFTWISLGIFLSLFSILSFVVCILLGRYFFKNQPPELYAQYSIEGIQPTNAIIYISYCIWKECEYVLSKKDFEKYVQLDNLSGKEPEWPMSREQLTRIQKLKKDLNSRFDEIQQIDHMIISLSKELNVPGNRISDYLFQFSPEIFTLELRKTLRYMDEILRILESEEMTKRRSYLSKRISDFSTSIRKIRDYQKSIIDYKGLHQTLIGLTSGFGITNALETYCLGIQTILRQSDGIKDMKVQKQTLEKLKFLYHKRRLFPGFDIHALLYNFYDVEHHKKNKKEYEKKKQSLLDIATKKDEFLYKYYGEIKENLYPLKQEITKSIISQRSLIKENFMTYLRSELEKRENCEKLIFVTQGYSSVVNDTLYYFAKAILKDEWKDLFKNLEIYYYILLSPKEIDNAYHTTSRYVRYHFKAYPNIAQISENRIQVKVGDTDWLNKRFGYRNDCLNYILSGAEFYQISNEDGLNEFRLINNEGFYDIRHDIFKIKDIKHIVMAEDFKKFPRPLNDGDIRKTAFNQDHFEYVHLYDWEKNRIIINGNATIKND